MKVIYELRSEGEIKFAHIIKVLNSCTTVRQVVDVSSWGEDVLNRHYNFDKIDLNSLFVKVWIGENYCRAQISKIYLKNSIALCDKVKDKLKSL